MPTNNANNEISDKHTRHINLIPHKLRSSFYFFSILQGVKTVNVVNKPGTQIIHSAAGQILTLPAQGVLPGTTQTMMIGN